MFFNIYSNQMKSVLASISNCNERDPFYWLRCKNASLVRISKGHKKIYSIRFKIEMKLGGSTTLYCHKMYAFAAVMVQIIKIVLNFQCLLMLFIQCLLIQCCLLSLLKERFFKTVTWITKLSVELFFCYQRHIIIWYVIVSFLN